MASLGWFRLRRRYFLFYLYLIDLIALELTEYEWLWLSVLLQILESATGLYGGIITMTISSFRARASYMIFSLGFSLIVLGRI